MTGQTSSHGGLVGFDDGLEGEKHGDHARGAATDDVTAVLQTKSKYGRVHILGGSYDGMLAGLTVQVTKK